MIRAHSSDSWAVSEIEQVFQFDTKRLGDIVGLNPNDPQSAFLTSVLCSPSSSRMLQWSEVSGRVYSIYWTPDLQSPFIPLATAIPWPNSNFTDNTHSSESSGFYKIDVQMEE